MHLHRLHFSWSYDQAFHTQGMKSLGGTFCLLQRGYMTLVTRARLGLHTSVGVVPNGKIYISFLHFLKEKNPSSKTNFFVAFALDFRENKIHIWEISAELRVQL